jgi:tetratricopeptide (TPR) repeat protein
MRHVLALTLAAGLAAGACASGPPAPPGPVVSPTGIVFQPGTNPPRRSRFSQTAALFLVQRRPDRALQFATEGITADSTNSLHYFLAGAAHLRLGQYAAADSMFDVAERMWPAFTIQTEPERAAGWTQAYDEGVQAYADGDTDAAKEAWRNAAVIYDMRPEAHRNLASLLARDEQYEQAIDLYNEALRGLDKKFAVHVPDSAEVADRESLRATTEDALSELLMFRDRYVEAEPLLRRRVQRDSTNAQVWADQATALKAEGRNEEAAQIYAQLLSGKGMDNSAELFSLGVGLFRSGDYSRASEAFQRLTKLRPYSRDAWFNYVNALLAGKVWNTLATAGDRLAELDPLGKNVGLIAARAHLETGDEPAALKGLHRVDASPLYVEGLQMQPLEGATRVHGQVVGNQAAPGTALQIRFTFYDEANEVGSEVIPVQAPSKGETTDFEVLYRGGKATGFRYELVP